MTERGRAGGSRQEPGFGSPRKDADLDLRLSAADRPGGPVPGRRDGGGRREPDLSPRIVPGEERSRDAGRTPSPGSDEVTGAMGGTKRKAAPKARKAAPKARRRRSFLGHMAYWTLVLGLWGAIGVGGLVVYHASKLPPIDQLAVPKRPPNIAILADRRLAARQPRRDRRAHRDAEGAAALPAARRSSPSRTGASTTITASTPSASPARSCRNVSGSGGMQGGSTLTQQLAKNLFLTQERTASRKIQEAILAIWLERNYSKDQILELYLNRVYFGSGAYGVEAAAQKYFGKSAREVTLAEAAMLAGLVQAPSRLAPNRNPEAAQARASLVIAAMAREGIITDQMAKVALMNPPDARAGRRARGR